LNPNINHIHKKLSENIAQQIPNCFNHTTLFIPPQTFNQIEQISLEKLGNQSVKSHNWQSREEAEKYREMLNQGEPVITNWTYQ
jgi:hypothetical protein